MKITQERYLALDVLRGLTVAFMIVVNTPGSWSDIYAPLEHAAWHGFTPTDLVFPTFLFVIGNAFAFSMKKLGRLTTADFFRKVLKRGALIFLIGWLLNAFPFVTYTDGSYNLKDFSVIRLWGVLQRIGVCYILAAILICYCSKRMLIIAGIGLLLGYWTVLYFCGNPGAQYTLEGNAVLKVELLYLPVKNMYTHYDIPFDPLGLLSTIPSVVNVVIGYLAGLYVQQGKHRVLTLFIAGLVMIVAGACWGLVLPINKALWTSSYVVYASGFDLLILAVLMLIIDVYNLKKWSYFFEVFGKNPLFMYILSWVLAVVLGIIHISGPSLKGILYKQFFTSWLAPKNASLWFALVFMLIIWCIGYIMDRKRIYVRV